MTATAKKKQPVPRPPLYATHRAWKKSALGTVTCAACTWHGPFASLLCEPDSRRLYCPTCTSTRWYYDDREAL